MEGKRKELVFPTSKAILNIKSKYDYHIYKKVDEKRFELIVNKNSKINKSLFDSVSSRKNEDVFINVKDKLKYQNDLQEYISSVIDNENVSRDLKAKLINDIARNVITDIFEEELTFERIKKIDEVLDYSIDFILKDEKALQSMLKITSYDYYTSTHCMDVSTYAIGFGSYLNLKKSDLKLLGKGALFHDIGKKDVCKSITCKKGKLTFDELEEMKNHPTFSVRMLKQKGETNQRLLNIIEQHHEKCDGSGYPKGLHAHEIDEFAKIVSICDIFNALTTRRTYKDRMSSFDAIKLMYSQMSEEICLDYLERFVKFLKIPT